MGAKGSDEIAGLDSKDFSSYSLADSMNFMFHVHVVPLAPNIPQGQNE